MRSRPGEAEARRAGKSAELSAGCFALAALPGSDYHLGAAEPRDQVPGSRNIPAAQAAISGHRPPQQNTSPLSDGISALAGRPGRFLPAPRGARCRGRARPGGVRRLLCGPPPRHQHRYRQDVCQEPALAAAGLGLRCAVPAVFRSAGRGHRRQGAGRGRGDGRRPGGGARGGPDAHFRSVRRPDGRPS